MFAHVSDDDVEDWQSAMDNVLRRFAGFHDLRGAFGRGTRAKGNLMERHDIDEKGAFEMSRERSRVDNGRLIDLAAAVDGTARSPSSPKPSPSPKAV